MATGVMADAYDGRGADDDPRRWPAVGAASSSAADIVECDSSVARYPFARPQHQHQRQPAGQFQRAPADADSKTAAPAPDRPAGHSPRSKWKARALYAFLACLLAVVVVNLALTLWFIRVTQFTSVTANRCHYWRRAVPRPIPGMGAGKWRPRSGAGVHPTGPSFWQYTMYRYKN